MGLLDQIELFDNQEHRNLLIEDRIRFFNKDRMAFLNYEIKSIQKIKFNLFYSYTVQIQNSDVKYKIIRNSKWNYLITNLFQYAERELGSHFFFIEDFNFNRLNEICEQIREKLNKKEISEKEIPIENFENKDILVL